MGSNIVASESLNMSGDIYNVNGKIHAVVDLNLSGKNLYNITTENKDGWQYKDIAQEKANIKADMKEKEYLLVSQKEEKAPSQNSNKNDTLEESAPKEDTTEEQPESQPTQTEPQPEDKKGITLDHRAEISSDGNMNISMSETLLNRAGDIYSAGNLNIEAKSILLDTIVMETSTNYSTGDSKNSYSKETYHLQNEVATLGSGGNMSVKTQDNFTSIGGKINVGGSAKLEIGGNFSMEGVYDYDYEKETTVSTKTKKKFGVKINSTKTTEELESEQYTANKGSFNVGGDLNIISENNITLKGVDLNVGGSAGMYAGYKLNEDGKLEESGYKGDVNIFHMEDISNSNYSKTVEKKGFTKDSLKGALNSVKDMGKSLTTCMACKVMQGESLHGAINDSFSGLNMEISMGYKDKTNIREESKTIVKSEIKTGGNLTMQSTGDMIQLSDVDVGGNYTRMAEGKIIDYEAHDTYNITQNHEREEVKFTMGIGNSYVDAANALNNVNEARKDVNQATSDLAQAEKDYAAGKISAAALNEARTMLAFATGNFANSTIGAAGSYGGAAGACATSLCTGLYANTGVKYQYSSSSSNDWSKTSVGSNVSVGGNMNIISDNYSKTGGSIDVAGDINFEVKHNLELHAGTNTYGGSSFDKNWELGVSGSTAGTASFNGSYSKSEDSYHGTTYDNLQIHAGGNINQSVGGDYLGQGVNMRAEGTLNQDIKGDKILESLQNEYESKGNSWGIRGGFSSNMTTGGIPKLSGVNGGFNLGSSKEYSKITNQASSETAGEGVYITVGGKFTNIGSIVANTDKDGNDKGNVISKAGQYEFQNLENIEYSREKGISFDVSVGTSGNEAQDNQHPSGSGTIGLTNKEVESRYETLATIGNGEILVKNDFGEYESYDSRHTDESRYPLSQPNRNIHHTETDKTTYTKHNLDGSLTVDLRFLTQSGREDIWHDLVSYPVLPMWSYYTMGQFDGNYPDLGINIPVDWLDNTNDFFKDNLGVDLELNSWCNEGCKEGYTMGHPVTGMDTYELNVFTPLNFNDYDFNLNTNNLANFKPMGQPTLEDFNIKKYSKAWMYDDHWGMKGVNKVPGAQTWSKAHDWYLTPMNGNKMFGDDQKWTIIPFAIMGTYGGLWGIFVKNKPGIGGIYGKN